MAEILILGAGITGISAAWHARRAGREAVIFEAQERWGGLLDHFELNGFRFDNAVHFAFSKSEAYRRILEKTEHFIHHPEPYNYEAGTWLKHPVQNNLYPLKIDEKIEAIKSFIERPEQTPNPNYHDWLVQQFGEVIAERFPARYTEKYWTVPAEMLSTDWIGNRLYRPSLAEVLHGAMTAKTPSTYYLAEMLYPRCGGFRTFLDPLVEGLDLRTGKKVVRIDSKNKYVQCSDGSREYYQHLVSSLPLPDMTTMLAEAPARVTEVASSLWATSVALVSLGFNVPTAGKHLWFYIYDHDILPSRVHAPHLKSPDNVPPGCSSLQFETYFSNRRNLAVSPEELVEHVISKAETMKLASRNDLVCTDYRVLPYGNVVFDSGMVKRRDYVIKFIQECGILPVGRFGEWDYHWSEQCFLSGKKVECLPGMV